MYISDKTHIPNAEAKVYMVILPKLMHSNGERTDAIYCFKQAQEELLASWPFMHPEEPLTKSIALEPSTIQLWWHVAYVSKMLHKKINLCAKEK